MGTSTFPANIQTMGQRNTLKIYGTVELHHGRFLYRFQDVFNADTYMEYLQHVLRSYSQKIFLIQDNAAYHKDKDVWKWFSQCKQRLKSTQNTAVTDSPCRLPFDGSLQRDFRF